MTKARNVVSKWGVVGGLLLAGLLFAGCKHSKPDQPFAEVVNGAGQKAAVTPAPVTPAPVTPSDPKAGAGARGGSADVTSLLNGVSAETLREGDSLIIIFSDLNPAPPPFEERINDQGNITLLYNQTFHAAGKNRGELEKEIRERYVPKYYKYMTPNVKPQERFYFVDGEVKVPARQLYVNRMTVTKAIGSCGDFTDFANKKKVRLTRGDGRILIVNCVKALSDPSLDLEVFPNDKIHVPRKILSGKKAGTSCVARRFPVRIGRAATADLQLEEEGIWDEHLRLEMIPAEGIEMIVQPNALARVKGEPVQQTVLRGGDIIQIGSLKMQFFLSETRQAGLGLRESLTWAAVAAISFGQVALIYWLLS
jgi:protein involved in polysaccharide export with SLBB domain